MIKVFGGVIRAAAFLAGAATLIALAGATILGANPYLDLAAQFLGPLAWTAVLGALAMFVSRRIVPALGLAAIAAAGVFIVWPRPVIEACALGAATHRVVFQNVWASNPDPAAVEAYLETTHADVIVLAESWSQIRPAFEPLKAIYPYTTDCVADGDCGDLLFSKFPLADRTQAVRRAGGPRSQVAAEIAFPDGTLHLIGVHLTRPWPFAPPAAQARQTKMLGAEFADLPAPRLLIGDLNAVTWGRVVRSIEAASGSRALPTWGTWRTNFPLPFRIPIDQTIAGPGLACAVKSVGPQTSSDHRPIIRRFRAEILTGLSRLRE